VRQRDLPGLALGTTANTKAAFELLTASVSGKASQCRELLQAQGVIGACCLYLNHLAGLKNPSESASAVSMTARGVARASTKAPTQGTVGELIRKKDGIRWQVARQVLRLLRTACGTAASQDDASAVLCLAEVLCGSIVLEAKPQASAAPVPKPSIFAPLADRLAAQAAIKEAKRGGEGSGTKAGVLMASANA